MPAFALNGWSNSLMTSRFQHGALAMFSPMVLPFAVSASLFSTCWISRSTAGNPPA